jgi:hypothetical protein
VSHAPAAGAAPADIAPLAYRLIAFCGALGRTAEACGTAPREEEPDDIPVWRRRP